MLDKKYNANEKECKSYHEIWQILMFHGANFHK